MRILVTGAAGFLGSKLCGRLQDKHEVIGADLRQAVPEFVGSWVHVQSPTDLTNAIASTRPDAIIHAAFNNKKAVGDSDESYLAAVIANNLSLFEAAAQVKAKLLLVSSSAVYGSGLGQNVIDEACPRRPVTLYGVAKSLQEMLADHSAAAKGLSLCIVRLFNLCGPDQPRGLLWADWLGQALSIRNGAAPILRVPHCRTARDFVDVRDGAAALALLVERFRPGECVNVASGKPLHLRELGHRIISLCSKPCQIVETDPRPSGTDVAAQCGSNAHIHDLVGWRPTFPWQQSLMDQWEAMLAQDLAVSKGDAN